MREHMSRSCARCSERRVLEFGELFDRSAAWPVLVVTFLALLELARELLIEITQSECFAPIYVKLGLCAARLKRSASSRRRCSPRRSRSAVRSSSACSTARLRADTLQQPAGRAARGLERPRGRAGEPRERLALPDARRVPALSRAAVARKAAALLARGDGDAGDHRLPPAGHPRRHRGHPRRRRLDARSSSRSRTAAGSTSSATAKRPAGRRSTPRPALPRRPRAALAGGAAAARGDRQDPPA